jgi:3alpha(or 20beta)-hydroxysteroid dehydrogenase
MNQLAGKVAIITGAAHGMGAAHARRFCAEGARVLLTDVAADEGRALAGELNHASDGCAAFAEHDVSAEDGWAEVVAKAVEAFGGLDILVNNAGIHWTRSIEDETLAGFQRAIDVNLIGTFLGIRAVIAPLRARGGGSIINICSLAGTTGLGWHGAYGASKWGARGLSRTAANELGADGIRVNAVMPGAIETSMLPADREGLGDARFARLPLGRAGQPDEVSSLVVFLASDQSSYITGGEFAADGGSAAGPPLTPRPQRSAP